jgi:hypothetical protein
MNKTLKIISILFIFAFLISCVSAGESLKKTDLKMYNDIIGTWYIFSTENPGEIKYTISFNENGTITGDADSLFGFTDVRWSEKTRIYANQPEMKVNNGRLSIFGSEISRKRQNNYILTTLGK